VAKAHCGEGTGSATNADGALLQEVASESAAGRGPSRARVLAYSEKQTKLKIRPAIISFFRKGTAWIKQR
jgi:hypothetical protein